MTTIVGCAITDELARDARQVIQDLRSGTHVADDRIVEVIFRMTEESLHAQFLEPTRALGAGPKTLRLIEISINTSLKATHYGLNKLIPKLNAEQMRHVADVMENSLHEEAALNRVSVEGD